MIKLKNNNMKLKLQNFIKFYNNFYIFLFCKNLNDLFFNQTKLLSLFVVMKNENK